MSLLTCFISLPYSVLMKDHNHKSRYPLKIYLQLLECMSTAWALHYQFPFSLDLCCTGKKILAEHPATHKLFYHTSGHKTPLSAYFQQTKVAITIKSWWWTGMGVTFDLGVLIVKGKINKQTLKGSSVRHSWLDDNEMILAPPSTDAQDGFCWNLTL